MRFETAPGEEAQIDWGMATIRYKMGDLTLSERRWHASKCSRSRAEACSCRG